MIKRPWAEISEQLDRLFFLPFAANESVELRDASIQAYLSMSGWNWDQVLDALFKSGKN